MSYRFPAAFLLNSFGMTALMIGLSLSGNPTLAAEVGIVQGATHALFFAFSANARIAILNLSSPISVQANLVARLFLLIPLGLVSLYLSVSVASAESLLALALILRRCAEWIAEVHLSEREVRGRGEFASRFISLQSLFLALALAGLLSEGPARLWGVYLWALVPLGTSVGFIRRNLGGADRLAQAWPQMWPHLGSTAMIGITVYVFRLVILLIVGRQVAGDLYAAFAIGSLPGVVYGSALAPTQALHEGRSGTSRFPLVFKMGLGLWALTGGAAFLLAESAVAGFPWMGKAAFFWSAVGLSMLGGIVMGFAQRIRVRLLQLSAVRDVFGPDVLMNMLMVAAVPYVYHLMGLNALKGLYLLNATLALVFYFSSARGMQSETGEPSPGLEAVKAAIASLLFVPLFFQLSGKVFNHSTTSVFDSQGLLSQVPIPVSLLGCLLGILLLGGYMRARLSLGIIFLSFMLMFVATGVSTHGQVTEEEGKLVLLFQFVVPMAALVLGQLYGSRDRDGYLCARAALYVVAVVTPLQLVFTWFQGHILLSPYLYLFSIYQHLQYVPVILACAYVFALFSLWTVPGYRYILLFLAPILGMYAGASMSILAMLAVTSGVVAFALYQSRRESDRWVLVSAALALVGLAGYVAMAHKLEVPRTYNLNKFGVLVQAQPAAEASTGEGVPLNVVEQIKTWEYHGRRVVESSRALLFGHARRPSRAEYPSARNYYLDLVFNFGVIALAPLLGVIGYTLVMVIRNRAAILGSPGLVGMTIVVLFLVLVDNSLKVGLRQPYPGIVTFFLWGFFLSRLSGMWKRGSMEEAALAGGHAGWDPDPSVPPACQPQPLGRPSDTEPRLKSTLAPSSSSRAPCHGNAVRRIASKFVG